MHNPHRLFALLDLAGALALSIALALSGGLAHAQAVDAHPVRIDSGTCDSPGAVAFELTAIGGVEESGGTPEAVVETVGAEDAVPLASSETELETSLSKLVADEHVIAVYRGEGTTAQMIACGSIGGPLTMQMAGMVMPGDELAVGLAEVGDSGHSGVALIQAAGTKAKVRLFLLEEPSEAR